MSLRELDLGFCKGARNYDLQRIAPLLSNLTYLNLAGGGRTDIVISKIAKHCPRLQRLSLRGMHQFPTLAVQKLPVHVLNYAVLILLAAVVLPMPVSLQSLKVAAIYVF
ncbi:hypothetical protein BDF22DRAFT_655355 [Syncephalis plumigaleata]|nr:hypothetical protein BDF22DRAFT_655355 [Syncephalis plumigaleata]